jgi:DeoR/GlpR family transcriptional regulator of sugar metabolism
MLAVERRQKILDLVFRNRSVQVTDLSRNFGVTEETIRRDLQVLDGNGLLNRTHGGAVARETEAEDLPYRMRQVTNIEAKRRIALRAAELVQNSNAVMIDSSSTAFEVLGALKDHHDLTLITNSVRITAEPGATHHTIVSVGGELRKQSMTFVGTLATQAIAKFNADIALISCKANRWAAASWTQAFPTRKSSGPLSPRRGESAFWSMATSSMDPPSPMCARSIRSARS